MYINTDDFVKEYNNRVVMEVIKTMHKPKVVDTNIRRKSTFRSPYNLDQIQLEKQIKYNEAMMKNRKLVHHKGSKSISVLKERNF